ncbi:putative ribosomal protein P0 is the functional equivalent of E.coli protein L10 [Trypoxylus dichotomus]
MVSASKATRLNKLGDSGTIFAPETLSIKSESFRGHFIIGVGDDWAAPHSIANGFKNLLGITAADDFKEIATVKGLINDPNKFVVRTSNFRSPINCSS